MCACSRPYWRCEPIISLYCVYSSPFAHTPEQYIDTAKGTSQFRYLFIYLFFHSVIPHEWLSPHAKRDREWCACSALPLGALLLPCQTLCCFRSKKRNESRWWSCWQSRRTAIFFFFAFVIDSQCRRTLSPERGSEWAITWQTQPVVATVTLLLNL